MFRKSSIKRLTIALVALMVFAVAVFAACSPATPFKQRALPPKAEPIGNGGIAVAYGEWLYYVNGNIASPDTANNSYTEDLRTGSIVRIKFSDLEEHVLSVNQEDLSSADKTARIEQRVREYAEMVVPNVYYTGNTDASLNGLYIFGDRIYITTPNDQLDSKGNVLTSQLVLASYNLGGGDRKTHLVFETNAPQLKLSEVGSGKDVYATYVLDGKLMSYKIGDKEPKTIAEEITSQQFSGNYVYYIDKDGSICRFEIGTAESVELVHLEQPEGHEDHSHKSYAIQKVNEDYVYYTISNSNDYDYAETTGKVLFYANEPVENDQQNVLMKAIPSSTYFCYGNKVIYTEADEKAAEAGFTSYIFKVATSAYDIEVLGGDDLYEKSSITLLKMEGKRLYYTVSNVTYYFDIDNPTPTPYAAGYSTSASGWAMPDVLIIGEGEDMVTYLFTLGTDSVSVAKFNPATKKNSVNATNITLKAEAKDDEE